MFDTVLLMVPLDAYEPMSLQLLQYRPSLRVIRVATSEELEALSHQTLAGSRLIAFTSPVIVPSGVLSQLGYGAYNFHPGPPSYPGLAPALFANYDGARIYGGTVHLMRPQVDSGPIVGVKYCDVAADATVLDLELVAFQSLAQLYCELANHMATNPDPLPDLPIQWSGEKSSRRTLTTACDISPEISAEELARRVAAFANNHFKIQPTITLHGYTFRLEYKPETEQEMMW